MNTKLNYTITEQQDTLEVMMQKSKFPWWILLLLIPLVLLIPIKRDFLCEIVETGNIPMAQVPVSFRCNDVGIFGSRTLHTGADTTGNDGRCAMRDVSEPLWFYLFVDSDTLYTSTLNDCPRLEDFAVRYKEFHRCQYLRMEAHVEMVSGTFSVINRRTGDPLPDAKVQVVITIGGNANTQNYMSDANGKLTLSNLSSCASISLIASKEGFIPDTIIAPIAELPSMSDDERTLKLTPEVPLVGKDGKLRINLQWNTQTDLDLVVFNPCGNSISFSHRSAVCEDSKGELDVDANFEGTLTDTPQENIYWEKVTPGTYRVCVIGWDNKRPSDASAETDFNVSIIQDGNRIDVPGKLTRAKLLKMNAGSQRWSADDYLVYDLTIEE